MTSALKRALPSYRLKAGARPDGPGGAHDGTFGKDWAYVAGSGDLDECNGRMGKTPEFPAGTYYYVLTDDYPFVPRLWRGTPDSSFSRLGPLPRGGPDGGKGSNRSARHRVRDRRSQRSWAATCATQVRSALSPARASSPSPTVF